MKMISDKVYLHYSNGTHRGPGKVVQNLSKGLASLGLLADPKDGPPQDFAYHGILQRMPIGPQLMVCVNERKCLFGPNLVVLPNEFSETELGLLKHMVVPSQWVKDLYRRFDLLSNVRIDVWSAGIDTETWIPPKESRNLSANLRCLLYFKNRSQTDLQFVQNTLRDRHIEFKVLEYGNYSEDQLREASYWASFGIILTNTESQGIAYMELLSTDLPLFVYDQPWWNNEGQYPKVDASSVPYFSEACGEKTVSPNKELFEVFLNNVRSGSVYSPRDYILSEHTLEKSASRYRNLLKVSI